MKNTLYIALAIIILSCTGAQKPQDAIVNSELNSLEIEYADSQAEAIKTLETIWDCKLLSIAKSETNFNGNVSTDISVIVSGVQSLEAEKREANLKLTIEAIKKHVLNYDQFSELKVVISFSSEDGERRTWSKTLKIADL